MWALKRSLWMTSLSEPGVGADVGEEEGGAVPATIAVGVGVGLGVGVGSGGVEVQAASAKMKAGTTRARSKAPRTEASVVSPTFAGLWLIVITG